MPRECSRSTKARRSSFADSLSGGDLNMAPKMKRGKVMPTNRYSSELIQNKMMKCSIRSDVSARGGRRTGEDENGNPQHRVKSSNFSHLSSGKPVKWDVSDEQTKQLEKEMGVQELKFLPILGQDYTPVSMSVDLRCPPRAPKVDSHAFSVQNSNNLASPALRGVADSFIFFRKNQQENPHGIDHFSKLSDEIILSIFKWFSKPALVNCAQVCKRWKRLAYDESLWKRLDLGRKHLQPGVVGAAIDRGVVYLRLAMSELKPPLYLGKRDVVDRYSKLQYLDLSMASIPVSVLSDLLQTCSQLRKLSLEMCEINDDICRHIAENKEMETLNMTMCHGLTTFGVVMIAKACQKLVAWNLSWVHLSSDGIDSLVKHLPVSLKRFNLSGCRHTLTDEHVKALVERCTDLIELDISDAPLLTNVAVDFIILNLPKLEHLHVNRCYAIAPASYLNLQEKSSFRQLEIFGLTHDVMLQALRSSLPNVEINKNIFSRIARPTVGVRRTSIWGIKMY